MKDKDKRYISMKEMLTKRSSEPITNCNCRKDNDSAFADILNQEIEAMKYFANKNAVSMFDTVNTCGVENQITEMAKLIEDRLIEANNVLGSMNKGQGYWIAQKLVEHYQPKIPEDSVVLSKEEYENIYEQAEQNVLANIADGGTSCHWCIEQHEKIGYERGSKETADKYKVAMMLSIQEMQKYLEIDDEQAKLLYYHNADIAKQFGGEIKEN